MVTDAESASADILSTTAVRKRMETRIGGWFRTKIRRVGLIVLAEIESQLWVEDEEKKLNSVMHRLL